MSLVLGIETSCDETSVCLLTEGQPFAHVLGHLTFSQEDFLSKWGGVVPEIAARGHLFKLTPLLQQLFEETDRNPQDLEAIGVTVTPGLLGPLLTGLGTAKTLALFFEKPLLPVNHLYAHLEAIHLTESCPYPYLGLLVSGGHSLFFLVRSSQDFHVLGSTKDDAAGEAFDKGGKILGLGYPAGRLIDEYARQGDAETFDFPIGLKQENSPHMSFSGLKAALKRLIDTHPEWMQKPYNQTFFDLCASYQEAIVQALKLKLQQAQAKAKKLLSCSHDLPVVVGGGVACNSRLRQVLKHAQFVAPKYCTDNGAMIAHYTLKNLEQAIAYPDCLHLDARGRFIDKKMITS